MFTNKNTFNKFKGDLSKLTLDLLLLLRKIFEKRVVVFQKPFINKWMKKEANTI